MDAIFALIDANNFYASCEQVFDPKFRGKPVIILSNNDGCVVSRSLEARKLGIKMGVPLFQIEQLIDAHDVQVFSSNYALYGDVSNRLMAVLQKFTPEVEIYSIDEGFMNLAGIHCETYQALGKAIQERVYKNTCVPVTVGIGETKTLAEVANYIAKKSERAAGVLDLARSRFQEEALRRTPVDEVWGIGPAYSKLLKESGINTALELRDADLGWARKALTVVGAHRAGTARGQLPVIGSLPLAKKIRDRLKIVSGSD